MKILLQDEEQTNDSLSQNDTINHLQNDTINYFGHWAYSDKWIQLIFEKKTDLNGLFDIHYAQKNEFVVINDSTVKINNELDTINILGVHCIKEVK